VNALLAVPPVRLAGLILLGIAVGSLVNWAIYALAWRPRPISPWQAAHPQAPPRRWSDFLPIVGWLGLSREAGIHGAGFWIRPLLIELTCGLGLAALYTWEMSGKLAPPQTGIATPQMAILFHEFVSHASLIALMLAATFIDFDEKTIPDEITIPGTLIGLALAACWPDSHLPVIRVIAAALGVEGYGPLLLTSTAFWPPWLDTWRWAALGVGIYVAWCVALIPALATLRRGWLKGLQFYFASIARDGAWLKLAVLAALGSVFILAVWRSGGASWQALLTALVGLAGGGLVVWAVRIVGWVALRKEAMGFGDVTLMAMIGAYLGWQACLVIFFLSPFAALVIALTQWAFTGRRDIAFGPYLCLAALYVIVQWAAVWEFAGPLFAAGWLVPAVLAVCLLLMMGLLMLWRIIEQAIFTAR
jgi:leader peptidase (prepilin peptidase) / N-methyltransferase